MKIPFVLQKACDAVKANVKADEVESIFYASTVASTLKTKGKVTCTVSILLKSNWFRQIVCAKLNHFSFVMYCDIGSLHGCLIQFQLNLKDAQTVLTNAITEEATTTTIYHAVAALANLGLKSKSRINFVMWCWITLVVSTNPFHLSASCVSWFSINTLRIHLISYTILFSN